MLHAFQKPLERTSVGVFFLNNFKYWAKSKIYDIKYLNVAFGEDLLFIATFTYLNMCLHVSLNVIC